MVRGDLRRLDRVYVGVRAAERETFESVAEAMGLDLSGMIRALVMDKARELALGASAKKRTRKAAR